MIQCERIDSKIGKEDIYTYFVKRINSYITLELHYFKN